MTENTLLLAIKADGATRGAREFGRATDKVERDARSADAAVNRVDRRMHGMGKTARYLRGQLVGVFGALAAGATARTAVQTIATFEQTMATVAGVTNATEAQMAALTETARNLGATTRFSATEAGEGILFLSRAGFTAQQSIDSVGATLNLAQSGAIGLGEAADFASNIVSGFGLAARDTERVVDTLVKTSNSANTDVRQLAEAMKYAAPIAGALGRTVEETSAAIGVLGDSGIQGSMAGTNLRGSLIKLIQPSAKAKKTIESMGLTLEEVNPVTNNLADVFQRLADANLTAERAAAIFMSRNAGAALVLANSASKIRDLTAANEGAAGSAQEMARVMDDTLIGAFKSLISVSQELFLQMGDGGLKGAIRGVLDTLTGALRILAGLDGAVENASTASYLLAKAIQTATYAGIGFIALNLPSAMLALASAITKVTFALAKNPIGLLLIGVSAGIVALIEFRDTMIDVGDYSFTLGNILQATWEYVTEKAVSAFESIRMNFNALSSAISAVWGSTGGQLVDTAKWITNAIIGLFVGAMRAVKSMADTMGESLGRLIDATKNLDLQNPGSIGIFAARLGGVAGSFNAATGNAAAEMGKALGEDYVGGMLSVVNGGFSALSTGILQVVHSDIRGIMERAEQLRMQQQASAVKGGDNYDPAKALLDFETALGMLGEEQDDATTQTADMVDAYKQWYDALNEAATALEVERLTLTGATDAQILNAEARARGIELTIEQAEAIQLLKDKIREDEEELERLREIDAMYENLGDTIAGVFDDIIFGGESIEDAMESMLRSVTRMVFQTMVLQQIARGITSGLQGDGWFSNLFGGGTQSALGNVFSHGRVVPMARGDIIDRPTMRRMSDQTTSLMGEAGTEAVVPLARDSMGRLGIRAEGEMSGGDTYITMNVYANDASSFRSSMPQIERDLARRMNRRR